ncbi:MAG TPA: hypothetical protein VFD23_03225, partial [Clostridia bacterium]|nr:hypothetical protein [Clostridia bacterium]
MTVFFAVRTTIEIIAVLLLIWGFINEEKFIAFEDKLARAVGIHIRNRRRRKAAEQRCKQQAHQCAQQCAVEAVCAKAPSPKPQVVKKNPVYTDYNV